MTFKFGIPDPSTDPVSLQSSVKSLKEAVEVLAGVRANMASNAAVTREEVIGTATFKELRDKLGGSSENVELNPDGFTTETALSEGLATKADAGHTHVIGDVTGLTDALAGKEPTIAAGTPGQYWDGDKTFKDFPVQPQKLVSAQISKFSTQTSMTALMPNRVTGGGPLVSDGTQLCSITVTTTTATQVIDFDFMTYGNCSVSVYVGAAIFVGSTAIAAANVSYQPTGTHVISGRYSPGAAGTYTLTARVGPNTAATLTVNYAFVAAVAPTCLKASVIEP